MNKQEITADIVKHWLMVIAFVASSGAITALIQWMSTISLTDPILLAILAVVNASLLALKKYIDHNFVA